MKELKRNLYIIKCRTHVLMSHILERVLHTLSVWGLIVEHKKDYTHAIDQGNPQTAPDLKSERFVFGVTYVIYKIEFLSEYWFETKWGKRIYTLYENHHEENRISFRAELKAFYCHFSHKQRMWVHSYAPKVVLYTDNTAGTFSSHTCDFSQCRFALEMRLNEDSFNTTSEEVIFESCRVLGNSLTSKVPDINKTLTGAENDGEIMSPNKTPLCDNILCRRCGLPVFASAKRKYSFWCIEHGELEYNDVQRVDPVVYKDVVENTMEILEDLIAHFDTTECPQDKHL